MELVAAYCRRYEPGWMVDQLRENLGWVDRFVEYDTSDADVPWVPAAERTRVLYSLATGFTDRVWYMQVAPDERLSVNAETEVRAAITGNPETRFTFRLRELWTPTEYRVDGVWGRKRRRRLYQLTPSGPVGDTTVHLDVDLYHLKMVEPENRAERVRVHTAYNTWDNLHRGFDYLTDETGLRTEPIPEGYGYEPGYSPYRFEVP